MLVARRGRPVSRDLLAEQLWPDEDANQLANRLSVALALVRRVFDPAREHATSHFLRAEGGVVALDLDHVHVDVEDFLRDGTAALRRRRGHPEEAHLRLRRIVDDYAGVPTI
jgi:DNA-binding SARP family transcriptional activator